MARDVLSRVSVVLMSSVRSILRRMIGPLITSDSKPRVYADVVVITFNNHLVPAMSLVVPMPVVIVVVIVLMSRVGRAAANIVIFPRRNHITSSKRPPVVMVVVVVVMMVMTRVGER